MDILSAMAKRESVSKEGKATPFSFLLYPLPLIEGINANDKGKIVNLPLTIASGGSGPF